MTKRPLAAICAALCLPLAMPAMADTAQLRYLDLDLTSDTGKAELARRIDVVALQACPAETVTGSRIRMLDAQKQCMADVRRQIEARLATKPGSTLAARQQDSSRD